MPCNISVLPLILHVLFSVAGTAEAASRQEPDSDRSTPSRGGLASRQEPDSGRSTPSRGGLTSRIPRPDRLLKKWDSTSKLEVSGRSLTL
jgi:hypothetical protein